MKIDNRKARIVEEEMAKLEIDNVAGDTGQSYPPFFNFFHLFLSVYWTTSLVACLETLVVEGSIA